VSIAQSFLWGIVSAAGILILCHRQSEFQTVTMGLRIDP